MRTRGNALESDCGGRRPRLAWARALLTAALLAVTGACAASTWADPAKTLRTAFEIDVTGFDPAGTQDAYSNAIEARIFDALYEYDYLARPYRLVPSLAAAMPEYSADGRTWTIRLKPGIHFAADPVFGGKPRELTAADVAYSWKRLVDPRVRSPNADLVRGKFVGLDAAAEKAKATGRFDYDAEIEGLRAVDRHTLQLKLVEPDYTLLSYLNSAALRDRRPRGRSKDTPTRTAARWITRSAATRIG